MPNLPNINIDVRIGEKSIKSNMNAIIYSIKNGPCLLAQNWSKLALEQFILLIQKFAHIILMLKLADMILMLKLGDIILMLKLAHVIRQNWLILIYECQNWLIKLLLTWENWFILYSCQNWFVLGWSQIWHIIIYSYLPKFPHQHRVNMSVWF